MKNSQKRIALASILILLFQILLLSFGSAEDWKQTTQSDFEAGTINQVDIISDPGSVRLSYVWDKYPMNPVFSVGGPGDWDRRHVFSPEVIYNGTMYKMWYSGTDAATARRIGYATSPNGIDWTRYGASAVFDISSPGDWDCSQVYAPSIIFNGTTYHMWYSGFDGFNSSIGYATSLDGISWIRYPINLCPDPGDGCVLAMGAPGSWDEIAVYHPSVVYNGIMYQMWYVGDNGSNGRIGYATSLDGVNWTKYAGSPVLSVGQLGDWDEVDVNAPHVRYDGLTYTMWYGGIDNLSHARIGYATSTDGINWTKSADNPILGIGTAGSWDDDWVTFPAVVYNGTQLMIWYAGQTIPAEQKIGLATAIYQSPGNLTSAIFDSGSNDTTWNFINWTESLPIGTNITMATRTGNNSSPDMSWSAWSSEMWDETGSAIQSPVGRFIQYRATLTTTDQLVTPVLSEVNINYSTTVPNVPPQIEVWEPGGTSGQIYTQGDLISITWNASDDKLLPSNPINITFGNSPGSWTEIVLNESNDGLYTWDTSGVYCPATYWMNLSVYDSEGLTSFDESNYSFDVLCPDVPLTIEVWEPGGSADQSYIQGETIIITWETNDDEPLPPNPINITYGIAPLWATIEVNEADDGNFLWDTSTVPCPGTYWMNLSVYDSEGLTAFDESNYSFEIKCPTSPPVIDDVRVNPDPQILDGEVTISTKVTDADTDSSNLTVCINITRPDGSILGNFTMSYDVTSGRYFFTSTYDTLGEYSFVIWAVDDTYNWAMEEGIFKIELGTGDFNWKPLLALIFTLILLLYGLWVSYNRPVKFSGDLRKDRQSAFMYSTLPFIIAEIFTGIASLMIDALRVPPIPGFGLAVDLIILFIGLSMITVFFTKGKNPESYEKGETSSADDNESEE